MHDQNNINSNGSVNVLRDPTITLMLTHCFGFGGTQKIFRSQIGPQHAGVWERLS